MEPGGSGTIDLGKQSVSSGSLWRRGGQKGEEGGQVLALLRPKDSCCSHHTKPEISPLLLGDIVLLGLPLLPGAGRKVCWPLTPATPFFPGGEQVLKQGSPLTTGSTSSCNSSNPPPLLCPTSSPKQPISSSAGSWKQRTALFGSKIGD